MNDYRRALDSCPIPEGLEQRLAERVLAAEPVGKASVIRPMSFPKKTLLFQDGPPWAVFRKKRCPKDTSFITC